jgi:hypothetical protein
MGIAESFLALNALRLVTAVSQVRHVIKILTATPAFLASSNSMEHACYSTLASNRKKKWRTCEATSGLAETMLKMNTTRNGNVIDSTTVLLVQRY